MENYCKWLKMALPALILVFVIWPDLVSFSRLIVVVSAALLLVHEFACKKHCDGVCGEEEKKPKKKKK